MAGRQGGKEHLVQNRRIVGADGIQRGVVKPVRADHIGLDPGAAHLPDQHRDIGHDRRDIDRVDLLAQGLHLGDLRRPVRGPEGEVELAQHLAAPGLDHVTKPERRARRPRAALVRGHQHHVLDPKAQRVIGRRGGGERVGRDAGEEVVDNARMHLDLGRLWLKDRHAIALGDLRHRDHRVRERDGAQHHRALVQELLRQADRGLRIGATVLDQHFDLHAVHATLGVDHVRHAARTLPFGIGRVIAGHRHTEADLDGVRRQRGACQCNAGQSRDRGLSHVILLLVARRPFRRRGRCLLPDMRR